MKEGDWFAQHRLFHYTRSEAVVASILERGFMLVPNRRDLIERLLPDEDFVAREPQQFGMVSFTELPVDRARSHREDFGEFGICVSWDWAVRNGAQRVIYLDESGVVFSCFQWLFALGRQELGNGAGAATMATTNKVVAAAYGAQLYHALLTLYEYMQTSRDSSQVEWRVVSKVPFYHDLSDRTQLIERLIQMSKVSTLGLLPLTENDVEMFVCPRGRVQSLRRALPRGYENVPIFSYTLWSTVTAWVGTAFQWATELRRRRDRLVYVPFEPPKGSMLLPMADDGRAILLPEVGQMHGFALYLDAVKKQAFATLQYQATDEKWFEIRMSMRDVVHLLDHLLQMEKDGRLEPYRR